MHLRKTAAIMVLCLCMLLSACSMGTDGLEQWDDIPGDTQLSDQNDQDRETVSDEEPSVSVTRPNTETTGSAEETEPVTEYVPPVTDPPETQPVIQTEPPEEPTQATVPQKTFDRSRTEYNIGSCRTLKEDAAVIVLFADDDESRWDEASILDAGYELSAAVQVIRKTAAAYEYQLELPTYYYYTTENRNIRYDGVIMTGGADLNALENIARGWGFRDKWEMHAALQNYTGMDQLIYVVLHNKVGRCYVQSESNQGGNEDWMQPEYCVISMEYSEGWRNGAVDYLHEILHLFGAQDFYRKEFGSLVLNASRAELARKICPNEVMLCECWDIDSVEISGFTAYCVGWIDFLPTLFDCDEWWAGSQWEAYYMP